MFRDVFGRAYPFAFFISGFVLVGCGQITSLPNPSSELSQITNNFPPVVEVLMPNGTGLCSGTFISPNAVLTASHCAPTAGDYMVVTSFGTFTTTNKVNFGPGVVDDPNDIAILFFSSNVASVSAGQVYPVSNQAASGDTVTLVGFGCDNIATEDGAGVKRMGTNMISSIDDYLEFLTPTGAWSQKILGPDNRAGSCFGDSGGPALLSMGSAYAVGGATHAGGVNGENLVSEYIDLSRTDNWNFLVSTSQTYNLDIQGL